MRVVHLYSSLTTCASTAGHPARGRTNLRFLRGTTGGAANAAPRAFRPVGCMHGLGSAALSLKVRADGRRAALGLP